jgi:D-arginine dehydrogenase
MVETADILVIGGGMAGIGAAARMAPDARVVVLEREAATGMHSTGRSAAIYVKNYGNAVIRALNAASEAFFRDPGDFTDAPLLTPRGEMLLAGAGEEALLEDALSGAPEMERLSPAEARAMVPVLRDDLLIGAALERDASDIDVDLLLGGFARELRRHGGRIVTGADVTGLSRRGGIWRVETAAVVFEAPVVVNAAGAWADHVAALAGTAGIVLQPMRRSAALIPAPEGSADWPLICSIRETWYAKPQSGKLMISPADEDPVDPMDAWPDDMVLAEGIDRFERATTVQVTRVERTWAGLRSFTPDRSPVAGFAPDAEGFFWLAGQGGYGIQTAPALSQLAADLVLERHPAIDAETCAALSPARFAA